MTISELYDKAKKISLEELFEDTVVELEEVVVDLNQKQMYDKGERADGYVIGEYLSPSYAMEKNQMNPRPGLGMVDLRYSGDFYRSMYLYIDQKGFFVDADVSYLDEIFDNYGEAMLGLADYSLSEFVDKHFRDLFFANLHKKLAS